MVDDTTTQNPVDPTMPAADPMAPVAPTPTPTPTSTPEPVLPGDLPAAETLVTEVPAAPVADQPTGQPAEDSSQM